MTFVPTVRCSRLRASIDFYMRILDFELADDAQDGTDPGFVALRRERNLLFLSSHAGDGVVGQAIVVTTRDVDALVQEFRSRGLRTPGNPTAPVKVHEGPIDQTWSTREFYVADPDGNTLRFVQGLSSSNEDRGDGTASAVSDGTRADPRRLAIARPSYTYGSRRATRSVAGRRWVLGVILVTLLLSTYWNAFPVLAGELNQRAARIVSFIFTLVICVFLHRGADGARWVYAAVFGLAAACDLVFAATGGFEGLTALAVATRVLCLACAVALLVVPSVRRYFGVGRAEPCEWPEAAHGDPRVPVTRGSSGA